MCGNSGCDSYYKNSLKIRWEGRKHLAETPGSLLANRGFGGAKVGEGGDKRIRDGNEMAKMNGKIVDQEVHYFFIFNV